MKEHDDSCPYVDLLNAQEMVIETLVQDLEFLERSFAEYKSPGLEIYKEWKKEVIKQPSLKDYLLKVECDRALGRQLVRLYVKPSEE